MCQIFSQTTINHILAVLVSVFTLGYSGKTVNFEKCSPCHRTTVAHFLNKGKWNDEKLSEILKASVVNAIYGEALRTGKPIFCIVDDTISSKTKPSSSALHPIENAYFHQSHLKGRQDYGHQAVAVMLSCNGLVLNYDIIMYDKSKSKIKVVCDVAGELPETPVISYLLCDSWYTSGKVMDAFLLKGFYTIGALKTNRVIYPYEKKMKVSEYAVAKSISGKDFRLVTVGKRQYYVCLYEGRLNGLENAYVVMCYPKEALGNQKALRVFLCTDVSLSTTQILDSYLERWPVELFFRESKGKLALDKYQIRSSQGIRRFWLLMSLTHFICCTCMEENGTFLKGYDFLKNEIEKERIIYIYKCGSNNIPIADVLASVG